MPIRYYEGIEGAGKSSMMTRDLLWHHRAGGQVLAFPGYELKEDDGEVISRTLLPEEWITLPESLKRQRIAVGIDEVTNFVNNHVWYNKICDMLAGWMQERRKFEIAFLMTGPIFWRLPPAIREMVHEIVHCQDSHARDHDKPRGERCIYYKEDLRGMLSERFPRIRFTRKKIFNTKPYWKNYDTYQSVDMINQFIKVRFKAKEIIVGADGKVISSPAFGTGDSAALEKYIKNYDSQKNQLYDTVRRFLTTLREKNISRIPRDVVWQYFRAEDNKSLKDSIGSIIKSFGGKALDNTKDYELSKIQI